MNSIKAFIHQSIKDNRKYILGFILLISLLSSAATTALNNAGLWYIGLIVATILVVYFFAKIHELTDYITSGNNVDFASFKKLPSLSKRMVAVFALYVVIALVAFLLINLLAKVSYGGLIILLLVVLIITISTGVVALVLEGNNSLFKDIKDSISIVFKNREILTFYIVSMLKVVIWGAMLTLAANVFAYGPQLQETLAIENVANEEIIKYFVSPLANFIQICGSQIIVFYILYLGFVAYKTLGRQLEYRSKKKRKKNR